MGLYSQNNKISRPKDDHAEKTGAEGLDLWIIPYADFMSTLMILFLMMFVFAYNSKQEKRYTEVITQLQKSLGGTVKEEVVNDMKEKEQTEQTVMKLDEMVEKHNLKNLVTVSVNAEQIKMMMSSPVLFDSGKTSLKEGSKKILTEMAAILKTMDNDFIVEGHTDNVPISAGKFKSNWELSEARATEVIEYFINVEKIPPARFAAAGYGEFHPIFPNDTAEHREQNRRIEINILRNKAKS
jgi:chemotaxis protein MotB